MLAGGTEDSCFTHGDCYWRRASRHAHLLFVRLAVVFLREAFRRWVGRLQGVAQRRLLSLGSKGRSNLGDLACAPGDVDDVPLAGLSMRELVCDGPKNSGEVLHTTSVMWIGRRLALDSASQQQARTSRATGAQGVLYSSVRDPQGHNCAGIFDQSTLSEAQPHTAVRLEWNGTQFIKVRSTRTAASTGYFSQASSSSTGSGSKNFSLAVTTPRSDPKSRGVASSRFFGTRFAPGPFFPPPRMARLGALERGLRGFAMDSLRFVQCTRGFKSRRNIGDLPCEPAMSSTSPSLASLRTQIFTDQLVQLIRPEPAPSANTGA